MESLYLLRITEVEGATLGVLLRKRMIIALTLENKWEDNKRFTSCIPKGEYIFARYLSQKHGETFLAKSVPNRYGILFHIGNIAKDTSGCILLGESYGYLYEDNKLVPAVLDSSNTFHKFLTEMEGVDQFRLVIREIDKGDENHI